MHDFEDDFFVCVFYSYLIQFATFGNIFGMQVMGVSW